MTRKFIFIILFSCLGIALYGQKASVRATVEPSDIKIGEQAIINLEVIAPKGANIVFPIFNDTIVKGIEVLGMIKPDTAMTEVMTINQKYIVTSFDSTLYHIDRIPVFADNDTIYSNELGLKVTTPQLADTTMVYLDAIKKHQVSEIDYNKLGLHDIKNIQPVDWSFFDSIADFFLKSYPYVLGFIAIIILIGVILFFAYRKRKKGYFFKPEIKLPPHIVALGELDKLKDSKIWQQGQIKEFYTRLTDIVREYIDGRYGIDAPEMTSDEILDAIRRVADAKSTTDNLTQILKTADLVKFAKFVPMTDENDLSLVNAYLFVNQTKVVELPAEGDAEVQPAGTIKKSEITAAESAKTEKTTTENENKEEIK